MPNQTEAWTPDPETVAALRTWLGDDGLSFFRECQTDHGRVDPVIFQDVGNRAGMTVKAIPHSVHFREGMQVRNFLRGVPSCGKWDAHDYDNRWVSLVEAAIAD